MTLSVPIAIGMKRQSKQPVNLYLYERAGTNQKIHYRPA